MAIINYNLRQITNHSISVNKDKEYVLNERVLETEKIGEQEYFILTAFHFGDFEGFSDQEVEMPLVKLGYICEPNAIGIPIYIKFQDMASTKKINIGKTGMFEIQTEELINEETGKVEILNFYIDEIKIPVGFKFSLDYIIPAKASDQRELAPVAQWQRN